MTSLTDGSLKGLLYRSAFVPWLRPCCGAEAASLGYAIAYVVLWGADPRRDVPAADFHPHLKVSSPAMAHVSLDAPLARPDRRLVSRGHADAVEGLRRLLPRWVLDGFDFTILTFLLVDIQRSFTVDKALAGALGTITLIFRVAGGIGAGTAADRWGRKGPLMFSILWYSRLLVPRRLLDVVTACCSRSARCSGSGWAACGRPACR